jgi:hypothetical protein
MNRRHLCQFAIAVASLAHQATFLQAQTTRITQDSEHAISNLTSLGHARSEPASIGSVDASTNDSVDLAVSGGIGMVNFEAADANLSAGSGSRRGAPILSSARFSQSKNTLNITTSIGYKNMSSFGGLTSVPSSSFAYAVRQVPDRQQTPKHARSSHSGTVDLDTISRGPESPYDERTHEDVSRMEGYTTDFDTTGAIQTAQQNSLEKLTDPFSKFFRERLEGFGKNLGVEQPCGVACSLRSPGRLNSYSSRTLRSDHFADQRYSHSKQQDLER